MKCTCCNKTLSDFESTRKLDGKYLDMCNTCFKESGLNSVEGVEERKDLSHLIDESEIIDNENDCLYYGTYYDEE